jgi:hypothetical protein
MLISSISEAGRCCCKWVENCSRFRTSNAELVMSGSAAAVCDLGRLGMTALFDGECPVWSSGLVPASVMLFCFWPP